MQQRRKHPAGGQPAQKTTGTKASARSRAVGMDTGPDSSRIWAMREDYQGGSAEEQRSRVEPGRAQRQRRWQTISGAHYVLVDD